MKSITICILTLTTVLQLVTSSFAQHDDQKTFEDYLNEVYTAYENSKEGDMWQYYSASASEITPDGRLTVGKEALKTSWDEFMKMVDVKPKFSYKLTSWRLITPEVALVTWDSTSDIKVQGQQMGGPATCVGLLHKINGDWKIEFDGMVPVIPMPAGN